MDVGAQYHWDLVIHWCKNRIEMGLILLDCAYSRRPVLHEVCVPEEYYFGGGISIHNLAEVVALDLTLESGA